MKLKLSENIRVYRKQRKLTQEKLAEALGVTVGAVYKWESGLSQPELSMIVELADFFDISVDVLLGVSMLVFTPVGGVLGDRFNKAAIMYLCDFLKGGRRQSAAAASPSACA